MKNRVASRFAPLLMFLILACSRSSEESVESLGDTNALADSFVPKLTFAGTEDYEAGDREWTRYKIPIENHEMIPDELFFPAPDLPPCGLNDNSSRTWVNIYSENGDRIYGFCAFGRASSLEDIWFAVPRGSAVPEPVYVVLYDRERDVKYRSNTLGF